MVFRGYFVHLVYVGANPLEYRHDFNMISTPSFPRPAS